MLISRVPLMVLFEGRHTFPRFIPITFKLEVKYLIHNFNPNHKNHIFQCSPGYFHLEGVSISSQFV